ncbi:type I-E CRISPR-associated protein Cas7/Cse4/CasC [Amorphus sp. 3PC139-8]|uniref:type I-E CRISPR-associated protein Cas7/Cse4/CasC n=1 Tax=Amorphus sp. 3PC139-8 TaxID=2735676 RepID=UPI00345D3F05
MSNFLQLHSLISYPTANLNRDDVGRPKTTYFGGSTRIRISSQCIKRAWRTDPTFRSEIGEANLGVRSRRFAHALLQELLDRGLDETAASERIRAVIRHDRLGAVSAKNEEVGDEEDTTNSSAASVNTAQIVHLSAAEVQRLNLLADRLMDDDPLDEKEPLVLLSQPGAVDIALFGRMIADNKAFGVEASAQTAHPFTVHRASIDDDFFSAVDDLSAPEAAQVAYIDNFEYGAGLFYQYLNVNLDLLFENLGGDALLARVGIAALTKAFATVNPGGKQAYTAARVRAQYLLVEKGDVAPRTLANAFLRPVSASEASGDLLEAAATRLEAERNALDGAYGACSASSSTMRVGHCGSLGDCISFAIAD